MRKLTAHPFGCTVAPGEGKLHLSSTITWRMRPRVIQDTTATHAPVLDLASNVTRPRPPNRPSFPQLQAPATAMQAQITVTLSHVAGLREQNTWACASLSPRMMPTSDAPWPCIYDQSNAIMTVVESRIRTTCLLTVLAIKYQPYLFFARVQMSPHTNSSAHSYRLRPPSYSYSPTFSLSSYHRAAPPARLRPLPSRFDSFTTGNSASSPYTKRTNVLDNPHAQQKQAKVHFLRLLVCGHRPRAS
jgi:hypothetical protein